MSSGAVSRQLDSLFLKAGIYEDQPGRKRLSANIIRKSSSTQIRDKNMGNTRIVADLMCHSKATADKHYHLRDKLQTASAASRIIKNVFLWG